MSRGDQVLKDRDNMLLLKEYHAEFIKYISDLKDKYFATYL